MEEVNSKVGGRGRGFLCTSFRGYAARRRTFYVKIAVRGVSLLFGSVLKRLLREFISEMEFI